MTSNMYDAIVAGCSISGLLAAREIAKGGKTVLVLEEGFEIGTPEHCGGLVSRNALKQLGIDPSIKSFDAYLKLDATARVEGGWETESGFFNRTLQRLQDIDYYHLLLLNQ